MRRLPAAATEFVGRRGELAEGARLLRGGRLGISTRTVEKHAENIRSKLGVESRTAVAEALGARS